MTMRSILSAVTLLLWALTSQALPVVNVTVGTNILTEGYSTNVRLTASDATPIQVYYEVSGTAVRGYDYDLIYPNPYPLSVNAFLQLRSISHFSVSPVRTVNIRLLPDPAYVIGTNSQISVVILDYATVTGTNALTTLKLDPPQSIIAQRSNLTATVTATDPDARHLSIQLLANGQPVAESTAWSPTTTNLTLIWTNPPTGKYTISAAAYDDRGRSTNSGSYSVTVAVDILRSLIPLSLQWLIPQGATNLEAYVRFKATDFFTNRFYIYEPGTLNAPIFIGEAIGYPRPDPYWMFDVTPWLSRFAGKVMGFTNENGFASSSTEFFLMEPSTFTRAPRVEWIPDNRPYATNDSMLLRARIISPEVAVWSYTLTLDDRLWTVVDTNLPPGTNIVSISVPALAVGPKLLKMYVSAPGWFVASDILTNHVVATLPNPEHKWLESNGKSFFVVDAAGRIHAWGDNSVGQLGAGFVSGPNVSFPLTVEPPAGARFRQVYCGGRRTYGLTDGGQLYGWGANDNSALLLSSAKIISAPVPVALPLGVPFYSKVRGGYALDPYRRLWSSLSAGTASLSHPGPIDDFDSNVSGIILKQGANILTNYGFGGFSPIALPTPATNWLAYSVCSDHLLMIGSDQQLYGFTNGQFQVYIPVKVEVPGVDGWLRVAAGQFVNLAVDTKGRLFWWGQGFDRFSPNPDPNQPREVEFFKGKTGWLDLTVTSANAMALSEQGEVFVWGLAGVQKIEGLGNLLDPNAPPPPANFVSAYLLDGRPTARIAGPKGIPVVVETSLDLKNWQPRAAVENVDGLFELGLSGESANLFFRVAHPR